MRAKVAAIKVLSGTKRALLRAVLPALCLTLLPGTAHGAPPCLEGYCDRYAAYAEKHPEKARADIFIEVNLHLDERDYQNVVTISEPESVAVLVTKHYALSRDYEPENLTQVDFRYAQGGVKLRADCCEAFLAMAQNMEAEGLTPYIKSGYRVNRKRGSTNSLWYAWPEHSEHQTGLAFDLRKKGVSYETMAEYKYQKTDEYAWLCENAYRYGFILSFPDGCSDLTGFHFEPWHWRYVGTDIAAQMRELKIPTFHEYWAVYLAQES